MTGAAPAASFGVLAVCSGNVCRSPLVELLLRQALADRPDLAVASAGTIARPRMRMTAEMVQVAHAHHVAEGEARAHRARRLDEELIASAGLVLALTRAHRAAVVELHPPALRRTFTLTEFARLAAGLEPGGQPPTPVELVAELAAGRGGSSPVAAELDDIRDPIGLPQDVYDAVGAEIASAVELVAKTLLLTTPAPAQASVASPRNHGPELSFSFRRL